MSTTVEPEELFEKYRHGDKVALERLYDQLEPQLYGFAFRLLNSQEDAEDAIQGTWERVVKHRAKWKSGTRFISWILAILRNVCVDRLRKRGKALDTDGASLDSHDEAVEPDASLGKSALEEWYSSWGSTASDPLFRQLVEKELLQLPHEYRVLILYAFEGLSYAEMAAIEGISESQVKGRLFRVRELLKERLAHHGYRPLEKASNPESKKVHHGY